MYEIDPQSIRTVMKENDGIMITRNFHLIAAKKRGFFDMAAYVKRITYLHHLHHL
jgi:hypothetical protein